MCCNGVHCLSFLLSRGFSCISDIHLDALKTEFRRPFIIRCFYREYSVYSILQSWCAFFTQVRQLASYQRIIYFFVETPVQATLHISCYCHPSAVTVTFIFKGNCWNLFSETHTQSILCLSGGNSALFVINRYSLSGSWVNSNHCYMDTIMEASQLVSNVSQLLGSHNGYLAVFHFCLTLLFFLLLFHLSYFFSTGPFINYEKLNNGRSQAFSARIRLLDKWQIFRFMKLNQCEPLRNVPE